MAISKIVQNSLDTDSISLGPKIRSVQIANSTYVVKDDTAVNTGGGYIVITGSGFTSNSTVLIGANAACSVTYISTTQLRAQIPAATPGSYPVYVVTGDGGTAIRVNALTYSDSPTWVTTSPLTGQSVDTSFSIQLSASGANTYTLQTGSSLPSGVSLAANGLLSGTVTGITDDTTYNFTVEAIDAEAQESPKALAITISGQYIISRSLRINSTDSAYLSRTPSTGNRKTWTWSAWVKRATSEQYGGLFTAWSSNDDAGYSVIRFDDDKLLFKNWNTVYRQTSQVFRDFNAWYHIVVALDTTQATASNRLKIYVNGNQVTTFGTSNDPTLNSDFNINNNVLHTLGVNYFSSTPTYFFNGYMAEVHFVDGTQLTPSSFGIFDNKFGGAWVPKTISGVTYGTNGFYLPFSDNTSTTTLGNDGTANNNDWTLNNFSVASGSNNDSVVDTPTNNGVDDGSGADVKGNYATFNSLAKAWTNSGTGTVTDGNLKITHTGGNWYGHKSTLAMTSGKWYFELENVSGTSVVMVGISLTSVGVENGVGIYRWRSNASKESTTGTGYGATWQTAGDIAGVAFDADAGTLTFYKNGVSQGVAFSGIPAGEYAAEAVVEGSSTAIINFGQRPFAYTAPSGFKTLSSHNLPTGINANTAATLANSYFGVLTYSGNGTANTGGVSNVVTGLNFTPDLVWIKSRNNARFWATIDSVRGSRKVLSVSTTVSEHTDTSGLASFNSGGLTFDGGGYYDINFSDSNLIAFCWKANGSSTVTNTDGTITSQVSSNPTAGFSIVTYTGNATGGATVGHGLGKVPKFITIKNRTTAGGDWLTLHTEIGLTGETTHGSPEYYMIGLNQAQSRQDYSTDLILGPTTTTFKLGGAGSGYSNASANYVAYVWAEIEGFSRFGTYVGNGSANGPFVHTGFKPAFVFVKRIDNSYDWKSWNNRVSSFNPNQQPLWINLTNTEGSGSHDLDMLSNGFKIRSDDAIENSLNATYIYAAWASEPLKFARAR